MSAFDQIIKGTVLPKVPLKTLFEEDSSLASKTPATYKPAENLPDSAQSTGAVTPFVKIGGQIVTGIDTMIIDETDFIPTISMVFVDDMGQFGGDYFPKSNIIMNVYLKASSEKFKPIRADFMITSVKSIAPRFNGKRQGATSGTTYMVRGELYIPNIYRNRTKSYPKLNSKDALKKICGELGLGFAENTNAPNDKMTWINPNTSNLDFIKDVIQHAYQDDNSFFMGFIDKYYYLNFIEVNTQLMVADAQKTFVASASALESGIAQSIKDNASRSALEDVTMLNYLTTEIQYASKPNYITELNLISDHGQIIKSQGYKKQIYYYDHLRQVNGEPTKKFIDFFEAPFRSEDRQPDQFIVPQEESLADNTIAKWLNIDYGNAHPEWNAARLKNSHNLKELDKIKLKVKTNSINFQVARGFTVPVFITVQQAEKIFKATSGEESGDKLDTETKLDEQVPDPQLTGNYYVSGVKYYYDALEPNQLFTEFFLSRREWAPSKITQ